MLPSPGPVELLVRITAFVSRESYVSRTEDKLVSLQLVVVGAAMHTLTFSSY